MFWTSFYQAHFIFCSVIICVFGLIIGSFLNVIIIRYPIMLMRSWKTECLNFLKLPTEILPPTFNLMIPGSRCQTCQQNLKPWQNIPLLSFLFLRGRCAYCQKRISLTYPVIELMSAFTTSLAFLHFGFTLPAIAVCIFSWGLLVLSGIDWQTQILPDTITLSFLWLGLLTNLNHWFVSIENAILGAIIGYLFLWIIAHLYQQFRGRQGMGHGDFKMLAMLGAWVGLTNLLNIILIATILSLIINVVLIIINKVSRDHPLPFGPSLAFAGWLTLFFVPWR